MGTFHSISEQHLQRYLDEFAFRWNNRSALGVEDFERADKMLKGAVGKRLTYRPTDEGAQSGQADASSCAQLTSEMEERKGPLVTSGPLVRVRLRCQSKPKHGATTMVTDDLPVHEQ